MESTVESAALLNFLPTFLFALSVCCDTCLDIGLSHFG